MICKVLIIPSVKNCLHKLKFKSKHEEADVTQLLIKDTTICYCT